MFKKKNKESSEKETAKDSGPDFKLHKMPKNYKIGRFESAKSSASNNKPKKSSESSPEEKTSSGSRKKIGLIIISLGAILVLFLAYIVFSYIKDPEFSIMNALRFNKEPRETRVVQTPTGGRDIADIVRDEIGLDDLNNIDADLEDEPEDTWDEDYLEDENGFEDEGLGDETYIEDEPEIINGEIIDPEPESILNGEPYIFRDSDGDGLSDEEEAILGTDPYNPDTDGDGYDDLTEVLNLYDPLGPGRLYENPNILRYENEFFNYNLLYPTSWDLSSLSDGSSVLFAIDNDSFIQVLVEKNESNQNIRDWYANRFFNIINESDVVKGDGWRGVYSEDELVFYLSDNNWRNVYTILYSTPTEKEMTYYNIFKMMIKSFNFN